MFSFFRIKRIIQYSRSNPTPRAMPLDDSYLDHPDFKRKLFAIDDIIHNTVFDRNRPLPPSNSSKPLSRHEQGVDCDEVFPGVIVGNAGCARHKEYLRTIGVTHVLNCAHGSRFNMVSTDEEFYRNVGIRFKGLRLDDIWMENISRYFDESAQFIDEALQTGGKVLVHCAVGISRSATIAIAYIMLRHRKSVECAVQLVRKNRAICPNEGFLRQLVQLDFKLNNISPTSSSS